MSILDYFNPLLRTSLYIHIPFCRRKCLYCDFFSVNSQQEIVNAYVDKVVAEIEQASGYFTDGFYTAYIGGGSPSILSPELLERICKAVCIRKKPEEFTVEFNPEHFSDDYSYLFENYFNRISMGVQSLNPLILKVLGRNASLKQTYRALELTQNLHEKTGTDLSYDLICCVRGSESEVLSDVEKLLNSFPSDHLSIYSLTSSEHAPLFSSGEYKELDNDVQADILKQIWSFMSENAYEHYEVSNFARKGKRCKHNMVYWNYGQFIGLGTSASGTAFGEKGAFRITGQCNIPEYNRSDVFSCYETEKLSSSVQATEMIMLGTRIVDGINLQRLKQDYGIQLNHFPSFYKKTENRLIPNGNEALLLSDYAAQLLTDF